MTEPWRGQSGPEEQEARRAALERLAAAARRLGLPREQLADLLRQVEANEEATRKFLSEEVYNVPDELLDDLLRVHLADDEIGWLPGWVQRDVEVGDEALAVALDDARGELLLDGPVGAVLLLDLARLHALEHPEQDLEGVVLVGQILDGHQRFGQPDDALLVGVADHECAVAVGEDLAQRADLADRFEVRVDGVVATERQLAGKPAPDTFLAAAETLGVVPERAVVVEDAVSGVEAGVAGGFGAVIGVDRHGDPTALTAAGADFVVSDLAELVP